MNRNINIGGRAIGPGCPPYIIAEISGNHRGSLETAKKLVIEAADAGADAVKLQTYRPDTITLESDRQDFIIDEGLWAGRTLWDLYDEAHTPWEWHAELFDLAAENSIQIFSSPFDDSAVDFLEELGAPAYKIASFEAQDLALIRKAAETGKPLIISTGMLGLSEMKTARDAAMATGNPELAMLHCVSGYPAPASEYNIATIPDMKRELAVPIGLSDHTLGNTTAICAVTLGADIIEKHFTLDRNGGGPDDSFSMEPHELKDLVDQARTAFECVGSPNYARKPSEEQNVKFQRSLYFVADLPAGHRVTAADVRSVRPGYGLAPASMESLIGAELAVDVKAAEATSEDHFVH